MGAVSLANCWRMSEIYCLCDNVGPDCMSKYFVL